MIKITIWEINKELLACLDTETGEVIDFDKLNQLMIDRAEKIEGIALWCKQLNAEAAAIDFEIKSLQSRKKAKESKAGSLRQYLTDIMSGAKFETARVAITWRKSDEVNILDESAIPEHYLRKKVVSEPDKIAIKAAFRAGENVDGAQLIDKQNIQIK